MKEKNERFLQILLDSMPVPVFYKNAKGIYSGCNESYAKFLGISKESFIGKSVYDISPKNLADIYYKKDKELFDHPGTQVYEAEVKGHDGITHNVVFNKATYNNEDGSLGGLIGVILDITKQKEAEKKLKQKFEELEKTNELMTGRELKMVELKKEIEKLKAKLESK
jgi:PAS domain S-box-containing protein